MDGHIMRCSTISSCQSAATSEIVKRCWSRVHSCKWRYSKCPDLYLYLLHTDAEYSNTGTILVYAVVKSGFKFFNTFWQLDARQIKTKKILARLDNFYVVGAKNLHKNRLVTKSSDAVCAIVSSHASKPYNRTGIHLLLTSWNRLRFPEFLRRNSANFDKDTVAHDRIKCCLLACIWYNEIFAKRTDLIST